MTEISQPQDEPKRAEESSAWIALIAIILGTFTAVLGNSLLNVALPKLVAVFGSTTSDIQWVITGYMLASAVVIPMCGFLGNRYGYKKIYLLSVLAFTVFSFLCGLAWNDTSLIILRILQGLGGGFIMPVGMSIVYMIFPREKIPVALGVWGIAAMAAPALGPTLSGYLLDIFSWRMLFFLNVPVGIIAFVISSAILKETPKREGLKFDIAGIVLSVIFLGTLLLALSRGQAEGWTSFYIVSLLFVSVFSLILFIWVEAGVKDPVIDLKLFVNKTFIISTLSSGFVMISMMGGMYLMPIYLQNIQSLSPTETGLLLMPQSIAMAVMMPISGKLQSRFGVVSLSIIGLAVISITTFELHRLTADTPHGWLNALLCIRGAGIGLCMNPLSTHAMSAVPRELVGNASSVSNVLRTSMGSMGIAVFTSIMTNLQAVYGIRIAEGVSGSTDAYAQFQANLVNRYLELGTDASSAAGGVGGILAGMVQKEAMVRSIADTFVISAIPCVLSIIFVLLLIQRKKVVNNS